MRSVSALWRVQPEGYSLSPNLRPFWERDFSTAGRLITGCRDCLDAAFHMMMLFLHGSYADIPDEAPMLSDAQASVTVPERLMNPSESTSKLFYGQVQEDGGNSDDEFSAEQRGGEQVGATGLTDDLKPPG